MDLVILSFWLLALTLSSHAFVIQHRSSTLHKSVTNYKGPASWLAPSSARDSRLEMAVSYEDLMERLPSKSVIDAVDRSAVGSKVVASDVATAAGVSLSQARKDLTALASIAQGDIAVDKDGELIYSFPGDLNSAMAQNSAKFKAKQTFEKLWPAIFWGVRVSFGVALVTSLIAIFSTIFFLNTSSSDDNRRDDRRGMRMGRGGYYGGFWGPSPFDFFYYRPYGYYGVYGKGSRDYDKDEMGFLESTFSYVFGDGDPNNNLEEKRLRLTANMIRENKGSVTAEQLAPFCDDAPEPADLESSNYVDESFVLPTVTALNGEPRVTDDGDIYYVFPELQLSAISKTTKNSASTASEEAMLLRRAGLKPDSPSGDIIRMLNYNGISTRGALDRQDLLRMLKTALPDMTEDEEAELLGDDPSLLQEREWEFSVASDMNKILAGGLGLVNLGGALYLGNLLGQYAMYGVQLPSYYGLVQSLYPFLLAYALLYNAIPLVRNFWINSVNGKIRERNKIRRKWRTALASAVGNSRIAKKTQGGGSNGH